MDKALKISFSLKNTYRVNSILYSLKALRLSKRFFRRRCTVLKDSKCLRMSYLSQGGNIGIFRQGALPFGDGIRCHDAL